MCTKRPDTASQTDTFATRARTKSAAPANRGGAELGGDQPQAAAPLIVLVSAGWFGAVALNV